jgi:STE24 endopeptidase
LAHANGIPVTNVYTENASRQSDRVSAYVSGIFGTDRITLNDNLLNRVSPEGVMSTMGHEMGHYVMHHIYNSILFASIAILL